MTDVFLSYASDDRDRVAPLVAALENAGLAVWWDRHIRPGPSYDREIEAAIDGARVMVVVWTQASVDSEWVRDEAEEGARRGILLPAKLDNVLPPLQFRRRQTADLSGWRSGSNPEIDGLIEAVRAQLDGRGPVTIATSPPRAPRRRVPSWLLPAALFGLIAAAVSWFAGRATEPPALDLPVRLSFEVRLPEGLQFPQIPDANEVWLALDPPGRQLLVLARDEHAADSTRVYRRRLGELEFEPMQSADDVPPLALFPSPDGTEVLLAYGDGWLRRLSLDSGDVVDVMHLPGTMARRAHWGPYGEIAARAPQRIHTFSPSGQPVPHFLPRQAEGTDKPGVAPPDRAPAFAADGDVPNVSFPRYSPRHSNLLVYTRFGNDIGIEAIELDTGKVHRLISGSDPHVAKYDILLFLADGRLWAVRLADDHRSTASEPIVALPDVEYATYKAQFDVADNGTLAYVPARADFRQQLVWVDRRGAETSTAVPPMPIGGLAFTDDQKTLAVAGGPSGEVHRIDLANGFASRLVESAGGGGAWEPLWTRDGRSVLFTQWLPGERGHLAIATASGGGVTRAVHREPGRVTWARAFTPDGRLLVDLCPQVLALAGCDIGLVDIDAPGKAELLMPGGYGENNATLSPDGRWLAYVTDAFGAPRAAVRAFPVAEGAKVWQLPADDCDRVQFSPDGSDLIASCGGRMVAVTFAPHTDQPVGVPRRLFSLARYAQSNNWLIHAGGERFLMVRNAAEQRRRVIVRTGWLQALDERLAGSTSPR